MCRTYHIILFSVKDNMIMNLWAWTILNKQCLSVSDDSWHHDEMWEQRFEASPGAHLNFQPLVRTVSQGAQHNHFTYSGVSVAKYLVRKNKNRCCTSQVSSSDMGSLFASFLSSFSWIKCVPCSSQHSVRLLQRDGLFKAAQVADNENEMEYMTLGKSSLVETIALCAPSGGFLPPLNSTALISSFTQSHPAGVFLIQSIVSCQMPLTHSRPPFGCWIMQPTSAWHLTITEQTLDSEVPLVLYKIFFVN